MNIRSPKVQGSVISILLLWPWGFIGWWGGCYISIHVSVLCDSVYQKTLLKDVSEMQFEGDIKSAPSEGQLLQVNVNDQ